MLAALRLPHDYLCPSDREWAAYSRMPRLRSYLDDHARTCAPCARLRRPLATAVRRRQALKVALAIGGAVALLALARARSKRTETDPNV